MNFSRPFIERPIGTTLLAMGLMLLGLVAYNFLPVASLPSVEFPTIRVNASLPGADAETMAARVAAPLERRLGEIPGVSELTSVNSLENGSQRNQMLGDCKSCGRWRLHGLNDHRVEQSRELGG